MSDAGVTTMSDAPPDRQLRVQTGWDHVAEQVSIEAERLCGTMEDGVAAVQAATRTCGTLLTDACARVVRGSVRDGVEFNDHVLALLRAGTPADVFRLNVEFVQKRMSSLHERLFEAAGVHAAPLPDARSPGDRA